MNPVNKRSVGVCILLSIFTGGIYAIYWLYLLVKNVRALKDDSSSCTGEMLCLLFVPFYAFYWWYTRGNTVKRLLEEREYHISSTGSLYLVLSIIGLGIVAMAIMQSDFNSLPSAVTQSQQRGAKKILSYLLITLTILAVVSGSKAENNLSFSFNKEQQLKILILADPQDTDHPQEAMLNLLSSALDNAQPDLVVFLGDMIHGPSVHGREAVEKAIDAIVSPVVQRNIPFVLVFGNHDDQSGLSNEEQLAIYQSYPGCLAIEGEKMPGCGNYYILIENSTVPESPIILWFLDSGTYAEPGKGTYGYVTEDQNAWMLEQYTQLKQRYEAPVSYAFQHIPVPQVYEMLETVSFGTKGAVTCYGPNFGRWYLPNKENIWAGGLGEGPCSSEYDSGEFAAWKTMNLRAAFFGHDHLNDYCGTLDGIDLIATSGLGFYMYGRGEEHGARLITLYAENPSAYDTKMLYYRDIVDAPLPGLFIPYLGVLIQQYVFIGFSVLILLIIGIVFLIRHIKKGKNQNAPAK